MNGVNLLENLSTEETEDTEGTEEVGNTEGVEETGGDNSTVSVENIENTDKESDIEKQLKAELLKETETTENLRNLLVLANNIKTEKLKEALMPSPN